MKQRILLVGDYNRNDFLFIARELNNEANFFFIEYLNENQLENKEALELGKVLYWKNYSDAYNLLEILKPDKVLFYFIESYNHVALNVACKVKGIPSYHLEHGVRFSLSYYKTINASLHVPDKASLINRIKSFKELYDKFLNRQFFIRTQKKSPEKEKVFLKQYYKIRNANGVFETFEKLKSPLRLPSAYISFSPSIFNFHKQLENLTDDFPVHYIGIPQFDNLSNWQNISSHENHILLIDQPLHEQGLYGWTLKHKEKFLDQLLDVVTRSKKKLFIKPHPWNDMSCYKQLIASQQVIIINNDWNSVIPEISIVLGFSSTLLLPFMAMKHVTCFTMEVHPQKLKYPYSQFLLISGACHASFDFEDLELKIKNVEYWHIKQKMNKETFINNYLYKFDGKATERLKNIVAE